MLDQNLLRQLIKDKASELIINGKMEPEVLLAAIMFCESNMGKNTKPRVEPAYLPGGHYFSAEHVQTAYEEYGEAAAASYGPWQVLYITAQELGFAGDPEELAEPETNLSFAIKYINERAMKRGAHTVGQVADAYNSGSHRDKFVPTGYVRKCVRAYNGVAREWLEGKDA